MATTIPELENAASQSTEQLTTKERILRFQSYLKEKENWEKEVLSEIQVGPETPKYETYKGPRGDDVKKDADRIREDLLTEKEEAGVQAKNKGDDAFRAGNFEDAVLHYQQAIVYCHPHNAVCWSNMSVALLKLKRWSEAEKAAKMALREHTSIHGWHMGGFHIKVHHRLGLANREMGRWEVAWGYFFTALQINMGNSMAAEEVQATMALIDSHGYDKRPANLEGVKQVTRKRWEETRSNEGSWASNLNEDDLDILAGTRCMPWAEDVQDLLIVSKGGTQVELAFSDAPEYCAVIEEAQTPGPNARQIERQCNECNRFPGVAPHMFCPACSAAPYCSEVCAVLGWQAHKTYCYDNRILEQKLPRGHASDAEMFKKMRKFDETRKQELGQACFVALGVLKPESRYDFQTHAGAISVKYDSDPTAPIQVLGIKKMSILELEEKYPDSFLAEGKTSLSQKREQMDAEARKTGALGTAVGIMLVEDGKWHCAMSSLFPVRKEFLDSAPTYTQSPDFEDTWEEFYVDMLNRA